MISEKLGFDKVHELQVVDFILLHLSYFIGVQCVRMYAAAEFRKESEDSTVSSQMLLRVLNVTASLFKKYVSL